MIWVIAADLVPFLEVLPPALLEYRVGFEVPEYIRLYQGNIAFELGDRHDGSLGRFEAPDIQVGVGAVHTHLGNDERERWRVEIAAHVADELREVGGVLRRIAGVDHVVPSLEPDESRQFVSLAGVI